MYPSRTDSVQAALEHMPAGPFANVDAPHLSIARYSPSSDFAPIDIEDKRNVDAQGVQDNLYWYQFTKAEDRINTSKG